jgi:hypothetical protein
MNMRIEVPRGYAKRNFFISVPPTPPRLLLLSFCF